MQRAVTPQCRSYGLRPKCTVSSHKMRISGKVKREKKASLSCGASLGVSAAKKTQRPEKGDEAALCVTRWAFEAPNTPGPRHASLCPLSSYPSVEINKLILNYQRKCKGLAEAKRSSKGHTKPEAHGTQLRTNADAPLSQDGRPWAQRETNGAMAQDRPELDHAHGQLIVSKVPKQVNEEDFFFLQTVLEQIAT